MKGLLPENTEGFVAAMIVQDVLVRCIKAGHVGEDTFGRSRDKRRYGRTRPYFNLWKHFY